MKEQHGRNSGRRKSRAAAAAALLSLVLSAVPFSAHPKTVEVNAKLKEKKVYLGQSFLYEIRVSGGEQISEPDLSGFDSFLTEAVPKSWVQIGTNEQEQDDLTLFYYQLIALNLGTIDVPTASVEVDGRTYTTSPMTVTVTLPPESEDYKLSVSLSRDQVYEGEPLELTAVWYYVRDFLFYNATIPLFRDADFKLQDESGQASGTARLLISTNSGSHILLGKRGTSSVQGKRYLTATYHQIVIPQKAGYYNFLPATVEVWAKDDQNRGGSDKGYRSMVVASNSLSIHVLPLPVGGKPKNFTGIISPKLEVGASVDSTTVNVGDPINLTITISGATLLDDVKIPPLDSYPGLKSGFSIHPGPVNMTVEQKRKSFTQTIRAKTDQAEEIPAIEIPFFNPESGEYETAASRPVSITVLPTRQLTTEDLEGEDVLGISGGALQENPKGIRYNYGPARSLRSAPPGLWGLIGHPLLLLLLAVPLALLFTAWSYAGRAKRIYEQTHPHVDPDDEEHTHRKRRFTALLERLDRGEHVGMEESLRAWREYVGSGLRLTDDRFTVQEIESALRKRGADHRLVRAVGELLGRYELYAYQGNKHREKKLFKAVHGQPSLGGERPGSGSSRTSGPSGAAGGDSNRDLISRMIATAGDLERYF